MKVARQAYSRFGILPPLAIALTGAAVVLPFLHFGIPSGHDFEFHVNSWLEVADDWRNMLIYPHWAAQAHFGYGEARFIFYPPFSWTLGAALGMVLPWKLVSAAYIWIAITLSGASMFLLARRWLSRADALFAAVFYAANPYHLVIVYWRSAMAELLAAACLPLLVLFALRSEEEGPRVIFPLGLVLGAGWLTNIPSAVMMNYSLAVILLCIALRRRSFAVLVYGGAAVVLGAAVAGIYLFPALHQQGWVNLEQVLSPGLRPQENFLFAVTRDPEHNQFNRVVSVIAVWELVILAGSFFVSRLARAKILWWPLLIWSSVCSALMSKITLPLWEHFPELRFVQLPWRWLLCLNVALALVLVLALRRLWLRLIVCAVAIGSVLLAWHSILHPWWDRAADIQEMVDNQHDGVGNDGTDEYVPAGADSYDIDPKAPLAQFAQRGAASIQIPRWGAEDRVIIADTASSGNLVLRLFNYPNWKVEVNGRAESSESTPHTRLMIVPLAAGINRIHIHWAEGWDRKVGGIISLIALLGIGACYLPQSRWSLKTESP